MTGGDVHRYDIRVTYPDPTVCFLSAELIRVYSRTTHPDAHEVTRWLKGEYIVSEDVLTDT